MVIKYNYWNFKYKYLYSLISIRQKLNYYLESWSQRKKVRDREGASCYQVHLETAQGLQENHTSLSFYRRPLLVLLWRIHLYLHPRMKKRIQNYDNKKVLTLGNNLCRSRQ